MLLCWQGLEVTRQCRLNLWGYVMAIVMNMSNYEIERTSETIVSDKPDLSNERRQMVAQLNLQPFVSSKINSSMPVHLATIDIDTFLQSMSK